jgi:hypothetical protein
MNIDNAIWDQIRKEYTEKPRKKIRKKTNTLVFNTVYFRIGFGTFMIENRLLDPIRNQLKESY